LRSFLKRYKRRPTEAKRQANFRGISVKANASRTARAARPRSKAKLRARAPRSRIDQREVGSTRRGPFGVLPQLVLFEGGDPRSRGDGGCDGWRPRARRRLIPSRTSKCARGSCKYINGGLPASIEAGRAGERMQDATSECTGPTAVRTDSRSPAA
jgi:hypothetical protein